MKKNNNKVRAAPQGKERVRAVSQILWFGVGGLSAPQLPFRSSYRLHFPLLSKTLSAEKEAI